jgi:predicted HTH domain antitoxin
MDHYDDLAKKAVAEIRGRFVQRNLKQGLQGGREGKLVGSARQVEGVDSFDLITWLVIKGDVYTVLSLSIPDSVLHSLKLPEKTVQQDLMKLLAVKLYEKGALGLGKASELCDATRTEFLYFLKDDQVFLNYDDMELDRDLAALESFR